MQMTVEEHKERNARSKKMLLWFAIISMIMVFAGLSSGYIVSHSRPDWKSFDMPMPFIISTALMLISSLTFHMAKKAAEDRAYSKSGTLLLITLVLGLAFVYLQFAGFRELVDAGMFLTGESSTISTQFLYMFVVVHLAHLAGGLISLLVIIYNHFKQKYHNGQTLGLELGAMFWHFLDFLWLYLFLFLYFFK
jgi:cytochrome c oxidase subunit 3